MQLGSAHWQANARQLTELAKKLLEHQLTAVAAVSADGVLKCSVNGRVSVYLQLSKQTVGHSRRL